METTMKPVQVTEKNFAEMVKQDEVRRSLDEPERDAPRAAGAGGV
jgi:hypothetical protein